jgi:hypothetical protein
MTAKQIAAIIESCCKAALSQVEISTEDGILLPLADCLVDTDLLGLCRAIAGNAAQILATDDESDGIPMQPVVDLDTGVTESVKVSL